MIVESIWGARIGIDSGCGDKPRPADKVEVRAYLEWLAARDGIYVPTDAEFCPIGICHDGQVIVAMPGYGAADTVIMETLDDAGDVIRSNPIGLDAKGKLRLDAKAVRAVVGPVEKPAKARQPRKAPAQAPAAPIAQDAAIAALVARIEALEAAAVAVAPVAPLPVPANDTSARRVRSEREANAIRRAWRIRCEARQRADLDARALFAANGAYRGLLDAYGVRGDELTAVRAELAEAVESRAFYHAQTVSDGDTLARMNAALSEATAQADNASRHLFGANERADAAERRAARMVRAASEYRRTAKRAGEDARGAKAEARALARRLEDANRRVATSRAIPAPAAPTDTTMARAFAAVTA